MADHNDLGNKGEELAQEFLQEKNYHIRECNWRFGKNEIDIIAMDNRTLVIAEVKTRSSRFYGEPEVFVTKTKQRFLVKAAHAYIMKNNLNLDTRFDILAVVLNPTTSEIHHIKNAFYPIR